MAKRSSSPAPAVEGSGTSDVLPVEKVEKEPKKTKMAFSIGKKELPSKPVLTCSAFLNPKSKANGPKPTLTVSRAFNTESDEEDEEEMPREARMRMRNMGRETPTSAGPNSFGKTKKGFCDAKKVFEKELKKAALETSGDVNTDEEK